MLVVPGAAPHDLHRPGAVFSSDIPAKIARCVSEKHLFQCSASRLVDLAAEIRSFEVMVELNVLLLRDPRLQPLQLVREGLVFVAKRKRPKRHLRLDETAFDNAWKPVLRVSRDDEVFVAAATLRILKFVVDLGDADGMQLEFVPHPLIDPALAGHIATYTKRRLVEELRNSDVTADIASSSTILQELPVNESGTLLHILGKGDASLLFDDHVDFDAFDNELRLLQLDDSKCTEDEGTPLVASSPKTPQMSKKPSFALVSSDDHSDLPYAFRSETVPRFIKDDKKFKFIKVGKVQKFVNLFEQAASGG